MSDMQAPSALSLELVAAIRRESAERRLSPLSDLRAKHPETDVKAAMADSGADDIRLFEGKSETYFFSTQSMTEAYALHIYRLEEKDTAKLVADTVRDDSRIYPRPTDIRVFLDSPFSLSEDDVAGIIGRLELLPENADIKSCRASNGALYLYSTKHLGQFHAESLVEWIEVGQRDNP